jgi:cytochrome c oxidase subunit 2
VHAWWVPALGWKQDAVPGFINERWTNIEREGVYRGQCAELCGKDHGFMPIVVKAVSKDEFKSWLAARKPAVATPDVPAPAPAVPETAPAQSEAAPAPAVSGA